MNLLSSTLWRLRTALEVNRQFASVVLCYYDSLTMATDLSHSLSSARLMRNIRFKRHFRPFFLISK